jgi:hypothetical protein
MKGAQQREWGRQWGQSGRHLLTCFCIFSVLIQNGGEFIVKSAEQIKPKYLIDEKGHKKAVVMDIKDYQSLMEFIEDLEYAHDLLKAEKKATSFAPYEEFRKEWLKS